MNGRLDGRIVAITGGTKGIGRSIAERFVGEGANVTISGRSPDAGQRFVEELDVGKQLTFRRSDVTVPEDVDAFVDGVVEDNGHLDVLVLNAGGVGRSSHVVDMPDEEWEFELALNLTHVFRATRRALAHMIPRGRGRIIAMSSIEGKHGRAGIAGYVANKHAINGFVKAVAKEVGPHGITVNAICPGLVITDLSSARGGEGVGAGGMDELIELYTRDAALGRPVTPEEVAAAALLLASDDGSGISGTQLSVDGGAAAY